MNLRTCLALVIATLWSGVTSEAATPVHTVRTKFRIPYRYDANEMARLGAKEIRLYLSTDRGVRWQQAMSVAPEAGKFDYEAPGDGEYWFAVRTLDSSNRLHPQGQIVEPELKVVVDTTSPTLDIQLKQVEPGKVQLAWTAADANLNPRELRLEYLQPGQSDWSPVSILPQAAGQTAWNVPQGGVVSVRGTVADQAGNSGEGQNQIRIEPGKAMVRPGVPDLRQPVADGPAANAVPNDGLTKVDEDDPLGGADVFNDMPRTAPKMPAVNPQNTRTRGNYVADDVQSRPDVLSGRYPLADAMPTNLPTAGAKSRVVNTRRFSIGYRVDDIGPSGVSAVELFITEDNGRKWFKYGVDADNQSPFDVEVPRDGSYGFAIRVRSGAGLAADPPQPGDAPGIAVVCDQLGPQVQMLPPQQGRAENMDKVLIRWKSSDDNPHEKPISLSYAAELTGPWQPITGWVANSGTYLWTVGANVPPRIYIRVTARDSAGNLSKAETPEPVVVDLSKPTARIVDIEPQDAGGFPR